MIKNYKKISIIAIIITLLISIFTFIFNWYQNTQVIYNPYTNQGPSFDFKDVGIYKA